MASQASSRAAPTNAQAAHSAHQGPMTGMAKVQPVTRMVVSVFWLGVRVSRVLFMPSVNACRRPAVAPTKSLGFSAWGSTGANRVTRFSRVTTVKTDSRCAPCYTGGFPRVTGVGREFPPLRVAYGFLPSMVRHIARMSRSSRVPGLTSWQ